MPDGLPPKAKQRLRIGFVHRFDARNIRSWSGIFYFMARALEAHVGEVVYLGPDDSKGTKFVIDNTARVNRYWQRITGKILATDKNRVLSHRLARFFERRIKEQPCDILFAPVASVEIAQLQTDLPLHRIDIGAGRLNIVIMANFCLAFRGATMSPCAMKNRFCDRSRRSIWNGVFQRQPGVCQIRLRSMYFHKVFAGRQHGI